MPPPNLTDLGRDLSRLYQWLADLDPDERTISRGRPQDRDLVLRLLAALPGQRLVVRLTQSSGWFGRWRMSGTGCHPAAQARRGQLALSPAGNFFEDAGSHKVE